LLGEFSGENGNGKASAIDTEAFDRRVGRQLQRPNHLAEDLVVIERFFEYK
jgi:hypothetical protein